MTSGGNVRSSIPAPISNATFGPSAENRSVSIRRSARVTPGRRSASSSVRSTATMRRIEVSASEPAVAIASRAGSTASGFVSATVRAAWACTTMPVMWWATRSCSSLASSRRSARRTECTASIRRSCWKRR
ncbi:hypothetical protein BKM31_51075 [[Actinomadura] parvosata subsp. kistnae]|uniref:Uncharacterized protein n=1 Tax=[Actinomadura] parvosata subsp. kistnae TaxID=1909395 RepID=A0A1V0AF53_9ACTN|nr:hypothetical protein BKM31_51075 [Nonomuraea sp. ATCC 55076]